MGCTCSTASSPGCIAAVPIFKGLSREEMIEVAAVTRQKTFAKGELIYSAGSGDKRLYVLHMGKIKVTRILPSGKSQLVRIVGPGDFLGELAIFNDAPLGDYAQAAEPCVMCAIDGRRLLELMDRYPLIAFKVLAVLSARLEKAESLIEDISLRPAANRVARTLLDLSQGRNRFDLELSKGDLASQIGMTQETLSRNLAALERRKLIGLFGQRTIEILNRSGLEKKAGTGA